MKPFTKKIVLENGREFYGYGFGADREAINEIVFNTSMVGYQEIMSDPSYTDQMVVMTYPLIGNYGMTDEDYETKNPTIGGMIVPKDDHIIVSLHIYAPWNFCGPDDTRADWGSDSDKQELDTTFQYLDDTFISKGIPVIIDETGCVNKNENTSARVAWFSYYLSAAKKHGIKCFIWDNNETKNGFGLLNRKDCTWYYPEIIQAIQDATK